MRPLKVVLHTVALESWKGRVTYADINLWHILRGFARGGYHGYINLDGEYTPGRPWYERGAHCKAQGRNNDSLGFCFEGHGDFEPWTPQQEVYFYEVLVIKLFHKYPWITAFDYHGHNEFDLGKTCPGKLIDMGDVRFNILKAQQRDLTIRSTSITTSVPPVRDRGGLN